jgi:hypothetical protein
LGANVTFLTIPQAREKKFFVIYNQVLQYIDDRARRSKRQTVVFRQQSIAQIERQDPELPFRLVDTVIPCIGDYNSGLH